MKKLILGSLLLCGSLFGATVSVNSPQTANTVLVGPTSGGAANPSFRVLVTADIPSGIITTAQLGSGAVALATQVSGQLPIANGGSGQATALLGFNALSPITTKADIITSDGTNNVRLGVGANNFVLVADSTTATGLKWAAAGTGAAFSGLTGGTNSSGAAMLVGNTSTLAPTGTGHITADIVVGSGSTTNAVDLQTAEVAGILTNNKGGTGADTSATGGAHQHVFQTSVGGVFTVAADVEADLPATTAFTDTSNIFSTVQTYQNYVSTQSVTPAQITSNVTAFDAGASSYSRVTSDASRTVQGLANGVNGRRLTMINVGSSPILISHEDAGAVAANRIRTPTNATMTLSPDYGVNLVYDSTDVRWRVVDIFTNGGTVITIPSGTSGGIPYYSATSTISSSGALTVNAIVFGGGAGAAPSTPLGLGTTTTLLHGNAAGAPTWAQVATADIAANAVDMATKMTGTMLAAQEPVHTGDVTNTGGSLVLTIAPTVVTAAKMVNSGVFTGDATTTFPAITIGNGAITAVKMVNAGVFTGDATTTFPSIVIGSNAITTSKIAANAVDMATKMTGTMLAAQMPALTGDVTNPAGSLATTIGAATVTAAKMVNSGVFTGDATTTFPAITIGNGAITAVKMVNAGVFTGDATTTFPSIVIGTGAITTTKIGAGAVALATQVSGTLPLVNGGTAGTTQQTALNSIAGSGAAKGTILVSNGTNWVSLPIGADNSVLTALAAAGNGDGLQWGAAGGVTVIAPLAISAGSVAAGTAVAPGAGGIGTTDANADFIMRASGTTKTVFKVQSYPTNTAPLIEGQKSDGTIQWQVDNTTNSRNDITEKLQTANQSNIQIQSLSENVTIAAAATSTSATNLLPANSYIIGVTARVTTVIPTAATFTIGVTGQPAIFAAATSTVNGTTASTIKQSPPLAPFTNSSAQQILITPNLTPGAATGTLRITVFYFTLQEPQN